MGKIYQNLHIHIQGNQPAEMTSFYKISITCGSITVESVIRVEISQIQLKMSFEENFGRFLRFQKPTKQNFGFYGHLKLLHSKKTPCIKNSRLF